MNQTEKIAQSRLPNKKNIDKTKMSFAPQSALTGEIKIDFNKLQAFRGKQMAKVFLMTIIDKRLLNVFLDVDASKWQILYLAKLLACHKIADFSEADKDTELKDAKKECLIEIIDILDGAEAGEYVINERVLEAAI